MPKKKDDIAKDKEKLLNALKKTFGLVTFACEKAGFSRQTFYRWCREDPAFKEKADDITEMQIDAAEASLLKKIKDGDTTATIFYLKTKGKHRGYTQKVEVAPPEDPTAGFQLDKLSPEQRKLLLNIAENQKIEDE